VASPIINPALLLRTIEVFLEPSTYSSDHTHSITRILSRHVIKNHFFRSLLELLKLRVPPPEDLEATPTPLTSSLLGYLTRPLLSSGRSDFVYQCLASEVLSSSHSPHIAYYVLPHLCGCPGIHLSPLVRAIHSGVVSGGVAPSLALLYAVTQLVHFRLNSIEEEGLVETYLHLVSILLGEIPSGHVTTGVGDMVEDEEEEEEVEGVVDPLSSRDAMLRHCLTTLGGEQLLTCLQLRR
jgi:hypothetical protein